MAAFALILTIMLLFTTLYITDAKSKALKAADKPVAVLEQKNSTGLSKVAKVVYDEYMSLPLESRPFDNVTDILKSLDATNAHLGDRDNHFDQNFHNRLNGYVSEGNTRYKFSWEARVIPDKGYSGQRYYLPCKHTNCEYSIYYDLHLEIARVKQALDMKRLALVRSDNAHNVAMADELVEALRIEAGIQKQTTLQIEGKNNGSV